MAPRNNHPQWGGKPLKKATLGSGKLVKLLHGGKEITSNLYDANYLANIRAYIKQAGPIEFLAKVMNQGWVESQAPPGPTGVPQPLLMTFKPELRVLAARELKEILLPRTSIQLNHSTHSTPETDIASMLDDLSEEELIAIIKQTDGTEKSDNDRTGIDETIGSGEIVDAETVETSAEQSDLVCGTRDAGVSDSELPSSDSRET